jgi:Sulfotransferase domain
MAQAKPLTLSEWDVLLGRCAAVTDMPCACFADESVEMYTNVISKSRSPQKARTNPDQAKVVLIQRDIESWHKSFSTNVIGISSAAPQTSW